MGIIFPKKLNNASKALIALLLISLSPILIFVVLLYILCGAVLYIAIWLTWKYYIEREILPHIQDRAMILNWSERRNWKTSLPVLAFRYFGGYRNFNPIAIIFRPFRLVKTYRFFEAFKEFKHGDPKKVEKIKRELFEILGI